MTEELIMPTLEELPPDHRSGFVVLAGKPNVGKSTLLNAWLGAKVAAVSPKPQTTRKRLLGILTRPDAQIIFVDTPGIHLPRTKLGAYMVSAAKDALADADAVLFVVDGTELPTRADQETALLLHALESVPAVLVVNKVDLMDSEMLARHRQAYEALGPFVASIEVSATTGFHLDELLNLVIAQLAPGPRFYPAEQLTDQEERFVASELIREQVMKLLEQEVPHAIAVVVEEFKERPNDVVYISAVVYVEKDSQKGIVIGRGGAMLKRIGKEARLELERFLARPVFLELWVKVRKNWRQSEPHLKQLGFRA
jgi:GTP-binding protein Era